jgi:hypothetical protein
MAFPRTRHTGRRSPSLVMLPNPVSMSTTSEEGLEGGYWEEEEAMATEEEVEEGAARRCTAACLI